MNRILFSIIILIISVSCSKDDDFIEVLSEEEVIETPNEEEETVPPTNDGSVPNILLIIADDMGLDASPGYDIGTVKPTMPNLQSLINSGIRFNNVWANPTCSPTRATMLTGKYGIRNGVVKVSDALSTTETPLHKYIDTHTSSAYASAVIGKWHLSANASHPNNLGIDYYAGSISGGLQSYWNWNLTINGQTNSSSDYVTTKTTDLAIDWIGNQTKPWFLWLAYNAPHPPFHLPPNNLHSQGSLASDQASINANPLPYYMAMLEAMDTEYGRLISTMSPTEKENTIIIFVGDNGTPNQVLQGYVRGKGTIFQGGINVPMILSGKGVTRANQSEEALINTSDLFATIAEIAGVGVSKIHDSHSFKSLLSSATNENKRDYIFAEDGNDDGSIDYAVRNDTHKYVLFENGNESFFNLSNDPLESTNLLGNNQPALSAEDNTIKNELSSKLVDIKN